jgi:hypothetical protein
MVDTHDLHQIEYRHHQTRDLSPVASSMSRESVLGWDARIRAWVRHPHSEALSESVCYQVFPSGAAALAWRYWDSQAAVRADGSLGRPLVSRVLIGQASVLTPEVAVALCRTGPAPDLTGPLPGHVAENAELPMVSGVAMGLLAREMTPALDHEAAAQEGLQAVVAAALAEPSTPLGISVEDSVIRKEVADGVQCPLLWGLCRVARPVLGPAGREWSFSTFELPLGDMDPGSLPRVVFRELQYAALPPPARTRREIQVRPFAPSALAAHTPYAARVDLAGWLVAEYQKRGGDWIEWFAAKACASEKTSPKRLERVHDALLADRAPAAGPEGLTQPVPAPPVSPPAVPAPPASVLPVSAQPTSARPDQDPAPALDAEGFTQARPAPLMADDQATGDYGTGDNGAGEYAGDDYAGDYADGDDLPAEEGHPAGGGWAAPPPAGGGHEAPGWSDERRRSLATSKQGSAPELPVSDRAGYPAGHPRTWHPEPAQGQRPRPSSLGSLLRQLELVRDDPRGFDEHLGEILRIDPQSVAPDDRRDSWDVIRANGWYERISQENSFYKEDVARIFRIVLIPELGQPDVAENIARWARNAPDRMIEGLLLAAKKTDPETWHYVMRILEPVLALLHAHRGEFADQWDPAWAARPAGYQGRGDGRGSGLWNRLRRG